VGVVADAPPVRHRLAEQFHGATCVAAPPEQRSERHQRDAPGQPAVDVGRGVDGLLEQLRRPEWVGVEQHLTVGVQHPRVGRVVAACCGGPLGIVGVRQRFRSPDVHGARP
jgi:hypothetical protein